MEEKTNTPPVTGNPVPDSGTKNDKGKPGTAASESQGGKSKYADLLAPYWKQYPREKAFIVTGDKQVFFEKDRGMAAYHQNSLANGEKIQIIKK